MPLSSTKRKNSVGSFQRFPTFFHNVKDNSGKGEDMKYTEQQLINWTAPLSSTEDNRAQQTINMIKSAIDSADGLSKIETEVFLQGSYANNTNVRNNSDVDVCVMCKSTFFTSYPEGLDDSYYGFSEGTIAFNDYKKRVIDALKNKFGPYSVTLGNKSVKIKSNTYHVDADVVPAFLYRDYRRIGSRNRDNFTEGIKLYAEDGSSVINYPKIHLSNGVEKNKATNHRYKNLVRIVKHIRNNMVDDGAINGDIISSFLVECLVWNFSNGNINNFTNYTNLLKDFITIEWSQMERGEHKEWGEVSECLYLFRGHKWTDENAKDFLLKMWRYLDFE